MEQTNQGWKWKSALVGAALSVVASAPHASGVFTVNPGAVGLTIGNTNIPVGSFQANFITGGSTTRVVRDSLLSNTATGVGYIQLGSFQLNSVTVENTFLNNGWNFWIEYEYTNTLTSGSWGALGSDYTINSLSYSVFAAPTGAVTFSGNAAFGSNPVVTRNNAALVTPIGGGGLLAGVAAINGQGGAAFNATAIFGLTPAGALFFPQPSPFYNIAFNNFNNNTDGVAVSDNGLEVVLVNQNGGVSFNGRVPTPSTLALAGLALLGVGFAARAKAKK